MANNLVVIAVGIVLLTTTSDPANIAADGTALSGLTRSSS